MLRKQRLSERLRGCGAGGTEVRHLLAKGIAHLAGERGGRCGIELASRERIERILHLGERRQAIDVHERADPRRDIRLRLRRDTASIGKTLECSGCLSRCRGLLGATACDKHPFDRGIKELNMRLSLRRGLAHLGEPRLHIGDRRRSRLDLAGERITDNRLRTHQRDRCVGGDLVASGACLGGTLHSIRRSLRGIKRSLLELRHAATRGDRLHCGSRVDCQCAQRLDLGGRARDRRIHGIERRASSRKLVRKAG